MKLEEFLQFQINNTKIVLTEEEAKKNPNQRYSSGRKMEIGDKVLVGFIMESDALTKLPVTIITFHEDEIGTVYGQDEQMTKEKIGMDIPVLKKLK
jgi:hypothetical protein